MRKGYLKYFVKDKLIEGVDELSPELLNALVQKVKELCELKKVTLWSY